MDEWISKEQVLKLLQNEMQKLESIKEVAKENSALKTVVTQQQAEVAYIIEIVKDLPSFKNIIDDFIRKLELYQKPTLAQGQDYLIMGNAISTKEAIKALESWKDALNKEVG